MLAAAIRSYLLSIPELTALIGTRLYPGWIPENADMPSVAYFEISGVRHHDIDVAYPRYQFSCFSTRYAEARKIAEIIRKSLQRYKGDMSGIRIIQGVHESTYEQYERETNIYHISVDMRIIHRE